MDRKMKSARTLGIKKLYKYRTFDPSNTKYIETIFRNRELYFPFPSMLNDPFECQFQIKIGDMSDLEYRARHRQWAYEVQKPLSPIVSAQEYFEYYNTLSVDTHLAFTKEIRDKTFEIANSKWGILSLSADPVNVLMWAHYANNHRGFCLEFDTDNDYFGRAWQVNYVDKINHIDILDINEDDTFNALLTKTKEWSYEKEFRVLSNAQNEITGLPLQVNNVAKFPTSTLTGIVFGARMTEDDISKVVSWLDSDYENVKCQKIILNPNGTLHKIKI